MRLGSRCCRICSTSVSTAVSVQLSGCCSQSKGDDIKAEGGSSRSWLCLCHLSYSHAARTGAMDRDARQPHCRNAELEEKIV
eukprot:4429141-Pyramimonas_sp.AAC.1